MLGKNHGRVENRRVDWAAKGERFALRFRRLGGADIENQK
jgi:hypothetical protein